MSSHPRALASAAAARQHNLVTSAQARACGLSDDEVYRLVARGEWKRIFPRVLAVAPWRPQWQQLLLAACLSGGTGVAASHRSAAAMWRLEGIAPGAIEVCSPKRVRTSGHNLTVHHSTRPYNVCLVDGIPTTAIERTLLDLGSTVTTPSLELALEDALRRGLTTLDRVGQAVGRDGGRGRGGSRRLADLVAEHRGHRATGSALETEVVRHLRAAHLPPPQRQYPVIDALGNQRYLDLAYPAALLGIEVEGYRWHSSREAWTLDRERRNLLTAVGWTILQATKRDTSEGCRNLIKVVRRFLGQQALEAR